MTRALKGPTIKGEPLAQPVDAGDPTQLVQYAVARGVSPGELKDLMDLADRERQRIAAEKFGHAFAEFQEQCPPISKERIVKNKESSGGGLRYKFAALEDIDIIVRPILARHKLSTSGTINVGETNIKAEWTIQLGSHKELRTFNLPKVAATGIAQGVNAVQDLGAWMTYIRRYTFCMALNIIVTDEDPDANSMLDVLLLTEGQRKQLDDWIEFGVIKQDGTHHRLTSDGLLKWLQPNDKPEDRSLDRLTQEDFKKIVSTFKIKNSAKGGA